MRKKKRNKLIRRFRIARKRLAKLNRKKVFSWLNKNLKGHPFILGLFLIVWINYIARVTFDSLGTKQLLKMHLKVNSLLFLSWFLLVVISNLLKDKEKVKWYLRKRFVMLMMVLVTPLGLILLWAGSKFKRRTKIIFTVIFALIFVINRFYQERSQQRLGSMSAFERVTTIFAKQKRRVFLKPLGQDAFKGLDLEEVSKGERIKLAISDMYSRYAPSIATIKTKDAQGKDIAQASGFVISEDGFIATNFHVINFAHQAEVRIGDRVFQDVYLAKYNPDMDIAVLKVNAEGLLPLPIGDSEGLVSGQFIIALGNPLGFEKSVSSGIISAIRSSTTLKLIQMTVPVSPGSSGCPVLNEYGEVVGIATIASFFIAQNLNFAVPINYLKEMVRKN